MSDVTVDATRGILTPDQRLRVFVSSTLDELAAERRAVAAAITSLHLTPVMLEIGARPYPPRELYRSYVQQSHVFVGIYAESCGWIAPGTELSSLEDEYRLSDGMPRLLYVKRTAAGRDPRLEALLDDVRASGQASYRTFTDADELVALLADDLAVLLTERFTDGASPPTPTPRLPPLTPSLFVGRTADMQRLERLLDDPGVRLVTVCGPGGIGKTRVALEAAHRTADRFPDGAVVVWLDAIRDAALVLETLAAELGIKEAGARDAVETVGRWLSGKRMLLILDNFEHVIAAAPAIARLAAFPTATKLLVTSRELLHVRGEQAVELEPLAIPGDDEVQTEALSATEAVTFFVDRATAAAPGFVLTADNSPAVAQIVRRLEGVPLALELAAARLKLLPPQALLARLEAGLDLPGQSARDLPERQQTLRRTIDWSYSLLDDAEREGLERLATFEGGAEIDAAAYAVEVIAGADAFGLLASLMDKSLLQRSDSDTGVRLRLLSSIRRYALEKLAERGAVASARDRHAGYFTSLAADLSVRLHSAEQVDVLRTFRREEDNIQAALEWLCAQERPAEAMQLANALRWFWVLRGHLTIADHWLQRVLRLEGGGDSARGHTLVTAGMVAFDRGSFEQAGAWLREAVALLQAAGDADGLAWARTGLGAVLTATGAMREAWGLQEQALETFRGQEDLLGQCTANTRLAVLSLADGDYGEAEDRFRGSLQVRRQIGDPWGTAYVLTCLGWMRLLAGDLDAADAYLEEALALVRGIGYSDGMGRALDGLGVLAAARGRWDAAADRFAEAGRLYGEVGNRSGLATVLAHRARAELHLDRADAAGHSIAAVELAVATGEAAAVAAAVETLGCVLAGHGHAATAAALLGAAEGIRDRNRVPVPVDDPLGSGDVRSHLGDVLGSTELALQWGRGRAMPEHALHAEIAVATAAVRDQVAPT